MGQLACDCISLPARPEAPDRKDKGGKAMLRDLTARPLWSVCTWHAAPAMGDKWELRPCMQTFLCTARMPLRLLMRFSGGLLKIIKKQFLQTQY